VDSWELGSIWLQLLTAVLWPAHRPMMLGCWAGDDGYPFTTQTRLICSWYDACLSLHYLGHGVLYYISLDVHV